MRRAVRQQIAVDLLPDEADAVQAIIRQRAPFEFEQVLPIDDQLPGGRRIQAAEQVEQRAFARAARSDDGDEFAFLHLEVDAAQRDQFVPADAVDLDDAVTGNIGAHSTDHHVAFVQAADDLDAVIGLQADLDVDAARAVGRLQDDERPALEGADGGGRQPQDIVADLQRHLHVDQLPFGDIRQRRGDAGRLVGILRAERQAADDTLHGGIRLVDHLTDADHADAQALGVGEGEAGDRFFRVRSPDGDHGFVGRDRIARLDGHVQHHAVDRRIQRRLGDLGVDLVDAQLRRLHRIGRAAAGGVLLRFLQIEFRLNDAVLAAS